MNKYVLKKREKYKEDYYMLTDKSFLPRLHITEAGYTYPDVKFFSTRKKSLTCNIEYIISGTGTIHLDDKTYIAYPGDTYVLPRNHDQYYYSNFFDPMEKIWINCDDDFFSTLANLFHFNNTVVFKNADTLPLIEEIHSVLKHGGDIDEMSERTEFLLFKIARLLSKAKTDITDISSSPISLMKYYIDNHITNSFSLDYLAQLSSMSKDHMIRLFKQTYGTTPYKYILERKLELACSLLRSSHMTTAQIAAHVGLCDERNMAKLFRSKLNTTPSDYRRGTTQ